MMKIKLNPKTINSILTIVVEFAVSIITVYITSKLNNYFYARKKRHGILKRLDHRRSVFNAGRSVLRSGVRRTKSEMELQEIKNKESMG